MDEFDIGIIGSGISGTFATLRAIENHKSAKVILFDLGRPPMKRRRQLEGFLGCFPTGDGKIYINDTDKLLDLSDGRKVKPAHKWVNKWFDQVNSMKVTKNKTPNVSVQKKIESMGFDLIINDYIQWKPESVHALSRIISDKMDNAKKLVTSFDNEVYNIYKYKNKFKIESNDGTFLCKKIIICVGRSGWRWVNNLYKDLGILVNDDFATFGVRVEMSAQHMKEFNKSHCTITRENLTVGPISWHGTIIPEDHADVAISAFRSNEDRWKTDKVSFSVLGKEYFPEEGCKQTDRLGKLAYLLFNDRIGKERVKSIIKGTSSISILPEYGWLKDTLTELSKIIPAISTKGYFHSPEILPMVSEIRIGENLESEIEGLFVAGESAGISGISAAATMGVMAIDGALK